MISLPPLPFSEWSETKDTLHLYLQIIGKIRMKVHPKLNHWWHVTLYPHVRGLTTGRIPYGDSGFEILYDMLDHKVVITRNDGHQSEFSVPGLTVAAFYEALFSRLSDMGIFAQIVPVPYDNKSTTPFPEDTRARAYDAAAVSRFWRALCRISSVFEIFRTRFAGKQTPVQLYWHSFDLVVTRFSGRAHPLEGGRQSDREAYSHEVISVGFWPGDDTFPEAAFYGYAYPEPDGMNKVPLQPANAFWAEKNGGALAILKYEDARNAVDPSAAILAFLDSLYDGAAVKANWPAGDLVHAHA
ncbi:hypothetical protein JM93_01250 [Roseibium hamelinense]|uniref:Ava_C0101 and related proteins n=1 Tax=Roseibium hamelinense TaxID=150831 RepID=A0A562T9F4_9HYPH|nr:DUF5996 family protein [Roseibium hamelinense]MTI45359.1 hypothetical protein [Roseibium hamelinense]TWI90271.1 hypothetical protein JM93_01250 [Roseibium hamelinense]